MAQEFNDQSHASYVDVPAILGGAFLALAISLVFTHFGSAIGLSVTDSAHWTGESAWTGNAAIAGVVCTGLWVLWTQISASMAGGYIAGRMRRPFTVSPSHEREIRDGAHGLLVWAVGTVAVGIILGLAAAFMVHAPVQVEETTPDVVTNVERNAAIIFAFVTAASSFVSAAASWWAATVGGEHRDQNIDHSKYVSFKRA
jgi:hypothetical protein